MADGKVDSNQHDRAMLVCKNENSALEERCFKMIENKISIKGRGESREADRI